MNTLRAVGLGLTGAAATIGAVAPELAHAAPEAAENLDPATEQQPESQALQPANGDQGSIEVISNRELQSVAESYGITVEDLLRHNGIDPSSAGNLSAGTRLQVPAASQQAESASRPQSFAQTNRPSLSMMPEVTTASAAGSGQSLWEWAQESAGGLWDGISQAFEGAVDGLQESDVPSVLGGLVSRNDTITVNGIPITPTAGTEIEVDSNTGVITITPGNPIETSDVEPSGFTSGNTNNSSNPSINSGNGSQTSHPEGLSNAANPEYRGEQVAFSSLIEIDKNNVVHADNFFEIIELVDEEAKKSEYYDNPDGYYLIPDPNHWSDLDYSWGDGTSLGERFADKRTVLFLMVYTMAWQEVAQDFGADDAIPTFWDASSAHAREHFHGGDVDLPPMTVNGEYNREANLALWKKLALLQWPADATDLHRPDGASLLHHVQFGDQQFADEMNEFVSSYFGGDGETRPKFNQASDHWNHMHASLDGSGNGFHFLAWSRANGNAANQPYNRAAMSYAEAARRVFKNGSGGSGALPTGGILPSWMPMDTDDTEDNEELPVSGFDGANEDETVSGSSQSPYSGYSVEVVGSIETDFARGENPYRLHHNWEEIFDRNNPNLTDEERTNIKIAISVAVSNGDRINPLLLVGQFGGESGFGTSPLAQRSNNGFGMTGDPNSDAYEVVGHNDNGNWRYFIKFDTIEEGVQYYIDRITSLEHYQDQLSCHSTIDEAINALWHTLAPNDCRIIARQGEDGVLSYAEASAEEYGALVHSVVDRLQLRELFAEGSTR